MCCPCNGAAASALLGNPGFGFPQTEHSDNTGMLHPWKCLGSAWMQLWAACSAGRLGWNEMSFKVPPIPNQFVIPQGCSRRRQTMRDTWDIEQSDCSCLKLCWPECRGRAHRRAMENLWIPQNPIICPALGPGVSCAGQTGPSGGLSSADRGCAVPAELLWVGDWFLGAWSCCHTPEPEQCLTCWGCRNLLSSTFLPSQRAQLDDSLTGRWLALLVDH